MPYIKKKNRDMFDLNIEVLCKEFYESSAKSPGDLNYVISNIVNEWINAWGGVSYTNINAVIGVLECAKQEIYRRVAAPYEDIKKEENGDVFM